MRELKNYKRASKHVRPELISGSYSDTSNYFKYDVKASKVSDEEIKKLAKLANDRLYKLEKSGQDEYSKEYQLVKHYADGDPNGKGSIYNTSSDADRIRFKSSARGMTTEERSYLVNTLRNFVRAETSTITGTRNAAKRALATYKENNPNAPQDMTYSQYQKLWKTYREVVIPDKEAHEAYNAFITMMETTDLYQLSQDQIEQAMKYIKTSEESSVVGMLADIKEKTSIENGGFIKWV